MGRLGGEMGRLAGAERGVAGGGGGGLDLTSGGTIGGNVTLNGHLTMGSGKVVKLDDGTIGAPGLAFAADLNTGLRRVGADDLSLVEGGADVSGAGLDLTSGGTIGGNVTLNGTLTMGSGKQIFADPGAVGTPGVAFVGDGDTGLYRIGANNPGMSAGATAAMDWQTALTRSLVALGVIDGAVGAPGLAFSADLDNGLYRIGANDWALSAGGVGVQENIATLVKTLVAMGIIDGTVGAPGLAFTSDLDNGLYRIGTNDWALSAGGTGVQENIATLVKTLVALGVTDGTVGAPGLAFTSDLDNGLYRIGANDWAASAGGVAIQELIATGLSVLKTFRLATQTQVIAAVTDAIVSSTGHVYLDNSAGIGTLISTPTIVAGIADGQILVLENTGASGSVVIQDVSAIASGVRLVAGTAKTLTIRDTVTLTWNAASSEWRQLTAVSAL